MPWPFFRRIIRNHFTPLLFGAIFSFLAVLPFSWNETLEDFFIDQFFKLRGHRALGENFVLVAIGAQDIQALGGWPLTRDYYGYLLHYLASRGASVIGFDLLWDQPHGRYPEHDATLSNLLKLYPNVCLPLVFSDFESVTACSTVQMKFPKKVFIGSSPVSPLLGFRKHAAGLGFSNFANTAAPRRTPLVAMSRDSLHLSFGAELARLYLGGKAEPEIAPRALMLSDSSAMAHEIPLDEYGQMRLNHFGDWNDVNMFRFVDLLRISQTDPDSADWRGKLLLVAVIDPTLTTIKATPLSEALPAALIHFTAAENIIHQNFLREYSNLGRIAIILCLAGVLSLIARTREFRVRLAASSAAFLIYVVLAYFSFAHINAVMPIFYPLLTWLFTLAGFVYVRQGQRSDWQEAQQELLKESVAAKQAQLEEAEQLLAETQESLVQQETYSERNRQIAEEQKRRIFALEKQLRDLQAYGNIAAQMPVGEFEEIICAAGGAMAAALSMVKKVAGDDLPVLICGETGTGKELIARAIHRASARQRQPFVAINCSALPENLLESELFGHERGSFTGAHGLRRGRFELANGGTLFLDEITETSPALQARLLRVLQDGNFERVGGEHTIKTDVRIIAACNRDLEKEIPAGRFRADLFYRLNGFQINLPSLRERAADVPLLAQHFLRKHRHQTVTSISQAAMAVLQDYAWPGNVRELENAIRRAAVLAQSEGRAIIQAEDLPEIFIQHKAQTIPLSYRALPEQILETLRALKFSRNAIGQTAKALGQRDRGTITEYFRGMCFEQIVRAHFDVGRAARALAGNAEEEVVKRVQAKIDEYLSNLRAAGVAAAQGNRTALEQACKGLPKKYHAFAQRIAEHFTHD